CVSYVVRRFIAQGLQSANLSIAPAACSSLEDTLQYQFILAGILFILAYTLPPPCLVFAWRILLKLRRMPPLGTWQRRASLFGVLLFTSIVVLWGSAMVRNFVFYNYTNNSIGGSVGLWASLGLGIVSVVAESKLRKYLILGAFGLVLFFVLPVGVPFFGS